MRKTFKLFCAAAVALLAVSSCGKIWDEFDNVHGQLDSIEARLDSLETALNGQVSTINTTLGTLAAADKKLAEDIAAVVADVEKTNKLVSALDAYDKTLDGKIEDLEAALAAFEDQATKDLAAAVAKIAVVKVEKNKAGNYVLTFADGNTLEVAAADANANNTGVITTVDVDGVTYWAVIGADGKTTVLDAAVHPDTKLQFKVDPKTHELYVAYDGKTWEKTGVIVNDDTTINVVTDFVDAEDYVTVTVAGKEYKLPKYVADNSELTFGRDEVYFAYGASKNLALVSEGITEYYVMSKPDGWKASIEDGKVVVTAPTTPFIEVGIAEAKGELLIHATTETGACKVVKVDLVSGPAMKISYDNGNVTFFTTLVTTGENWDGFVWTDWTQIWAGLAPVEVFAMYESIDEFYEENYPEIGLTNVLQNVLQDKAKYIEGEREELVVTMSMTELLDEAQYPGEFDPEEAYVMWVVPNSDSGYGFDYDKAIYSYVGGSLEISATETVYNNVSFDATFVGTECYFVGASSKSKYDEWVDESFTYEDALMQELMGDLGDGPLSLFNNGDHTGMGEKFTPGVHSFDLTDILVSLGGGMGMVPGGSSTPSVDPNTEYFVWILPYSAGNTEYSFEDLELYTFKSASLEYNADIKATVTVEEVTFESALISIVVPDGGSTAFELMTAEDFEYFMNDGAPDVELLAEYMSTGWSITEEYYEGEDAWIQEYGDWAIYPNTSYVFVTYNVVEGEYSVDFSTTFTTPEDPASVVPSPDKKQWVFTSEYFDMLIETCGASYCFDLGVAYPELYADYCEPNHAVIAVDYGTIPEYAESGCPLNYWMSAFPSSGTAKVIPTDETSGTIEWLDAVVKYSNLTETTCTFDFAELLGEDEGVAVANCTLATEFLPLQFDMVAM